MKTIKVTGDVTIDWIFINPKGQARRFTPDDQRDHELKGIAEIDLAKHRNGETGMFKLAWIGGYTKFENLADEDLLAG